MEMEELKRSLPVTVGKVNAIVAKRDEWTETELNERKVAFGPVSFSYRDIISFSEIFTLVDADGSGQICAGEVKHLMHLLGERVDTCDVEALMAEFDLDGSGEVDLTEFIFVIAMQRKSDFNKKDVIRAFDLFARATQTRPGVINKEILEQALLQYGTATASPKEIRKLVENLPVADNAYQEFEYGTHIATFLS